MRKISVFLIPLLAVAAWFAYSKLMPAVGVVHPVRGPAVRAVYATGTVEATVMMPIAPRTASRLMSLDVDEGSKVTKDQVLAKMEDDDLQHSIAELEAREELARKTYERNAALVKKNFVSKQTFDESKMALDVAIEAKNAASAKANYQKLLAPADGLIIKRDGEIGQMIGAGEPVFWLSCCAPLRISAEVDEEYITQVKAGQEVLIRADAFPGQVFKGKVQSITPKGDPISRSYRARIEFAESTPLQIGMTAETNIIISEEKNALLVPGGAVVQDKVWLVKDGKLTQQTVEVGAKGGNLTEIKNGVSEEDLVIQKPDKGLSEGKRIRTRLLETPKP